MKCCKLVLLVLFFVCSMMVAVPCSAARFGSLPNGRVETFVSFDEGNLPEGIAIHKGTMYVSNSYLNEDGLLIPEVLRIDPAGDVSVFTSFHPTSNPEAFGRVGLAIGPGGDVLAAIQTLEPETQGVWRIGADGEKMRLPGSQNMVLPNALTFDARGNLYVTESLRFTDTGISGGVWRFAPDGTGELWIESPLLSPESLQHPLGIPPVGANGIAFHPPNGLYVANTQKGLVVNIGINPDGSPSEPRVVAESPSLLTLDGIAIDAHGDLHGAIPGFAVLTAIGPALGLPIPPDGVPPIVEIDPATGDVTRDSLAEFDDLFDIPLSLTFDGKSVFVTNGAMDLSPVPIPEPGPGVIEVGLGEAGFPVLGQGRLIGGPGHTVVANVPEPSSIILVITTVVCLSLRGRR